MANLKRYTVEHGKFLAGATGLPTAAVQNDLLGHVLELKAQLDSYAAGDSRRRASLYRDASSTCSTRATCLPERSRSSANSGSARPREGVPLSGRPPVARAR